MMNDYQKAQAAKAERYKNFMNALAPALQALIGGKVEANLHGEYCEIGDIALEAGRKLHVRMEYNKPRATISGIWPRNAKGETFCPCSYDKSEYSAISV